MGGWKKSRDGLGKLLPIGLGAAMFLAFSAGASAEMSEIDAFQRAINSQTKKDALAFIDDFGTSHLVPDLIELLRPEVAMDVCANLPPTTARARAACEKAAKATGAAPTAAVSTTRASDKSVSLTPAAPAAGSVAATPAKDAVIAPAPAAEAAIPKPAATALAPDKTAPPAETTAAVSTAATSTATSKPVLAAPPAKKTTAAPAAASSGATARDREPRPAVQAAETRARRDACETCPVPPAFVIVPGPIFERTTDSALASMAFLPSVAGPVRPPEGGLNVASRPVADITHRDR